MAQQTQSSISLHEIVPAITVQVLHTFVCCSRVSLLRICKKGSSPQMNIKRGSAAYETRYTHRLIHNIPNGCSNSANSNRFVVRETSRLTDRAFLAAFDLAHGKTTRTQNVMDPQPGGEIQYHGKDLRTSLDHTAGTRQ